jgi:hypothetical protein
MSVEKVLELQHIQHIAPELPPDAILSNDVVTHLDGNAAYEGTSDNDAWFISFAQLTVDRMLKRYGISCSNEIGPEPITSSAVKLAA